MKNTGQQFQKTQERLIIPAGDLPFLKESDSQRENAVAKERPSPSMKQGSERLRERVDPGAAAHAARPSLLHSKHILVHGLPVPIRPDTD